MSSYNYGFLVTTINPPKHSETNFRRQIQRENLLTDRYVVNSVTKPHHSQSNHWTVHTIKLIIRSFYLLCHLHIEYYINKKIATLKWSVWSSALLLPLPASTQLLLFYNTYKNWNWTRPGIRKVLTICSLLRILIKGCHWNQNEIQQETKTWTTWST